MRISRSLASERRRGGTARGHQGQAFGREPGTRALFISEKNGTAATTLRQTQHAGRAKSRGLVERLQTTVMPLLFPRLAATIWVVRDRPAAIPGVSTEPCRYGRTRGSARGGDRGGNIVCPVYRLAILASDLAATSAVAFAFLVGSRNEGIVRTFDRVLTPARGGECEATHREAGAGNAGGLTEGSGERRNRTGADDCRSRCVWGVFCESSRPR
jgi:hypothetical protein